MAENLIVKLLLDATGLEKGLAQAQATIKAQAEGLVKAAQGLTKIEEQARQAQQALVLTRRELEARVDVSGYVTASGRVASAAALSTDELRRLYEQQHGVRVVVDETGGSFVRFGERLQAVSRTLLPVSGGIAALGTKAVLSAADFEKAGNVFQAVSGATAEQLEQARQKALQLGRDTSFSAGEAMRGLVELAKAGMTTEQAIAAIDGVLDLAAASGVGVAEAATLAASSLNMFGLSADQAGRVANVLAATANASAVEITDVAYALQQCGTVAAHAGLSIEDAAAAIGLMGNAGIRGSDAGTSLKTMLQRLVAPTKEAEQLFQQLGIRIFNADGSMRAFGDIVKDLSRAFAGLTDEQRQQALVTIFGSDAIRAANILIAAGAEGWDQMRVAVSKAGQAQALAEANMKGLSGAIEYFKGTLDSLLIEQGTPWLDFLNRLIRGLADALTAFGKLPAPVQQAAVVLAGLLVAAVPLLWVFGQISAAIPALTGAAGLAAKAFTALRGAMSLGSIVGLVTNPIFLIIAALAALAAGAYLVIRNWEQIKSFMVSLWTGISAWLSQTWEGIRQAAGAIWNAILEFFRQWGPLLLAAITGPVGILVYLLATHWDQVRATAEAVWNGLLAFLRGIWDGIVAGFRAVANGVVAAFTWLYEHNYYFEWLVNSILAAWGRLKDATQAVWNALMAFLEGLWQKLLGTVRQVWQAIQTAISTVWNAVRNVTASAWNAISSVLVTVWNGIRNAAQSAFAAINGVIQSAWNAVRSATATAWNAIKGVVVNAWTSIRNSLASMAGSIIAAIREPFDRARSIVMSIVQQAASWGRQLISNFVSGIRSMIGQVVEAARSVANAAKRILGFHSPAEEGPGKKADTWGPNLVRTFAEGIRQSVPLVRAAIEDLMAPVAVSIPGGVAPVAAASVLDMAGRAAPSYQQNAPLLVIQNLHIRNDQDILKLSQEIQNLNRHTLRALGVGR